MTYPMGQSKHVYTWRTQSVMGLRGEKNMAASTPQFKIKGSLEWGELARVVCGNFSKWTYQPNIKTLHSRETVRHFLSVLNGDIFCLWRCSASAILSKGKLLWKRWLASVSHFNTNTSLMSVIYFSLQESQWLSKFKSALNSGFWDCALSQIQQAFLHPEWFVTFTTSAKESRTAELCFILPKYCKTFDSL